MSPNGDVADTPSVTFPLPLLLEAITTGGIYIGPSRVQGHCGYRDDAERVIALNPEAPTDQVAEDLADHLRALAAARERDPSPPDAASRLSLVHSVDRPEQADDDPESGPRVVG